ncbi:MAG: hypothetical protein NWF13_03485 [Candidatus Bathyarchaeota archaeon]|nr:hypothetical protein [Candidatus Bathyarchaeota archaeon]
MKVKITNRKMSVLMIIIFAGFIISLSSSAIGLQDQISVLTNENARLKNDDAELQDSLSTLPFIQPFIQIGRDYYDDLNMTTGRILSIKMEEKAPIYAPPYKPSAEEFRLCWVIKFEQANRPGHHYEVWIDASTSEIIGMLVCA